LPRYPIKTVIPIAFLLLFFQGGAILIRQVAVLRGYAVAEEEETQGHV